VKYRFAKLIGILDSTLDENTKNQIIESLGKECSKSGFAGGFKITLKGSLTRSINAGEKTLRMIKKKK